MFWDNYTPVWLMAAFIIGYFTAVKYIKVEITESEKRIVIHMETVVREGNVKTTLIKMEMDDVDISDKYDISIEGGISVSLKLKDGQEEWLKPLVKKKEGLGSTPLGKSMIDLLGIPKEQMDVIDAIMKGTGSITDVDMSSMVGGLKGKYMENQNGSFPRIGESVSIRSLPGPRVEEYESELSSGEQPD
jgi:predicted small secreted protein